MAADKRKYVSICLCLAVINFTLPPSYSSKGHKHYSNDLSYCHCYNALFSRSIVKVFDTVKQ